jgi:hypothetical protein
LFIGHKKNLWNVATNVAPNDPNLRIRITLPELFTKAGGQLQRLAQQKKER